MYTWKDGEGHKLEHISANFRTKPTFFKILYLLPRKDVMVKKLSHAAVLLKGIEKQH
jgi:hypothetical protein